jgi:hypothetical protein
VQIDVVEDFGRGRVRKTDAFEMNGGHALLLSTCELCGSPTRGQKSAVIAHSIIPSTPDYGRAQTEFTLVPRTAPHGRHAWVPRFTKALLFSFSWHGWFLLELM